MRILLTSLLLGISSCGYTLDESQHLSYSIGVTTAQSLISQGINVSLNDYILGFSDVVNKQELQMSTDKIQETLDNFSKKKQAENLALTQEKSKENLKKGKDFLAFNKKKSGVVELKSGLQYKVIKKGKGKSPNINDKVTVNYRGTLIDGKEFDSSYKRNEAISLPVKNLIAGWQEALQLMKPGAKWQLFVPPHLAYGEQQMGSTIGPNSTLVFDIELIDFANS